MHLNSRCATFDIRQDELAMPHNPKIGFQVPSPLTQDVTRHYQDTQQVWNTTITTLGTSELGTWNVKPRFRLPY